MELVDGVYVGEEQSHQPLWHGILLDHGTAEPLPQNQKLSSVCLFQKFMASMKIPAPAVMEGRRKYAQGNSRKEEEIFREDVICEK